MLDVAALRLHFGLLEIFVIFWSCLWHLLKVSAPKRNLSCLQKVRCSSWGNLFNPTEDFLRQFIGSFIYTEVSLVSEGSGGPLIPEHTHRYLHFPPTFIQNWSWNVIQLKPIFPTLIGLPLTDVLQPGNTKNINTGFIFSQRVQH